MDRRPGFWIAGLAAVLTLALVTAPLWDAWRYRRLRSVGPHVPVGMILPLRTVPPAPPRTHALEPIAAPAPPAATRASSAAATEPSSATSASPAMALPASSARGTAGAPEPPAPPRGPAGHAEAHRIPGAPHAGPAALRREHGPDPGTAASRPGADTGNRPTADAIGWVAVPPSNAGPQPPPEPQEAPPPPKPAAPAPGPADPDPRPTPQAIPTLQLVPVRPALSVGDSLVVSVRLSGASDVTSLPFHVEFDPAVLEFQSVEEGPAVGGSLQPILLASVSPARPGDLAVGLSLVETGGLLQGDGTVMRLKFRAIGPGSSPLDFSHATIRGRMSETLDARFQNAAIEVR